MSNLHFVKIVFVDYKTCVVWPNIWVHGM